MISHRCSHLAGSKPAMSGKGDSTLSSTLELNASSVDLGQNAANTLNGIIAFDCKIGQGHARVAAQTSLKEIRRSVGGCDWSSDGVGVVVHAGIIPNPMFAVNTFGKKTSRP